MTKTELREREDTHKSVSAPLRTRRGGRLVHYREVRPAEKHGWRREALLDVQQTISRAGAAS